MKNLFEADAANEVLSRIDRLEPASQHLWGKMEVAQMMAHCSATLDMACGQVVVPRMFIGRILGPLARPIFTNEKPFGKNGPTNKQFKIADKRDFAREQGQLKARVHQFHEGGESQCTKHPHPFFGPIPPLEWATGMYKHLDHHLRQFGV